MVSSVRADTLTFTLDTNVGSYGSLTPPSPTGPWASATFTQVNDYEVTLDLHALPGLESSFISAWGFNSSVSVSDLTIVAADVGTLVKVAGLIAPDTFFEPPSTPVYSFGFSFNDGAFAINPPFYFFPYYLAEDLNFDIFSSVPISAATFDEDTNTAPLVTEALIKDSNGGVWGASTGTTVGVSASVPTPSAASAGLVLLAGLGLWKFAQRMIRPQEMA